MDNQPIEYEDFIKRLNLPEDKISLLLYDLYVYEAKEDKKDNNKMGEKKNE